MIKVKLNFTSMVFQNSPRSMGAIPAHGLLAASGLVLVPIYVVMNSDKLPQTSLRLFVVAVLGGFIMFGMDVSKKTVPKGLAVTHAGAAAVALLPLILFIVNS